MSRFLILCALVAFLTPGAALAAGLTVTEDEAVITGAYGQEWRLGNSADEEAELKKEYKDKLTDPSTGSMDQRIQDFEKNLDKSLEKRPTTALNPFLIMNPDAKKLPGNQGVVNYENNAGDYYAASVRLGADVDSGDMNTAKNALGIEDEADVGDGKAYKMKTQSGVQWVQFVDVQYVYCYQKQPGTDNRGDPEGSAYTQKTVDFEGEGAFTLDSDYASPAYAPESSFDPGVNKDETQQAVDLASGAGGKGDVRMEVVVRLKGKVKTAATKGELASAVAKELTDYGCSCEGRSSYYVEDYMPPLPTPGSASTVAVSDFQKSTSVTGAKVGYAFAIPSVRHYRGDKTIKGGGGYHDANKQPVPLYGYPNSDDVDRDGYAGKDYTWKTMQLKSDNPSDDALNKTLNYEVGLSLGNRVKYVGDPANPYDKSKHYYMYWIAPRRTPTGKQMGPYLGKVKYDSHQEVGDSIDKYAIDKPINDNGRPTTTGEFYAPFYKPVNFRNKKQLDGLCRDVYRLSGDPGESIQAERGKLKNRYPKYPNIAGISVKWNRECVQGITLGGTIKSDPELNMEPYTMMLPYGFASYENESAGRVGGFDASTEPEKNDPDAQKSLVGTAAEGTSSADSFFKVNAADCCNNDVVIASGTYGAEDNIKPSPYLAIEEHDVRAGFQKPLKEVAYLPNGPTGAGDPLGKYDVDVPQSRIHDCTIPTIPSGGSGLQGSDFKGYGDYSNNAEVWDGRAQQHTLTNPVDRDNKSFFRCRIVEGEPPIEEDRRCRITISAEDNIAPTVEAPGEVDWNTKQAQPNGRIRYAIAYLGYNFYYMGDKAEGDLASKTPILGGTVLNLDPMKTPADDPKWEKPPMTSFDYSFRRPGWYCVEVIAIDRNANKRTMIVPVEVKRMGTKFRAIDVEGQRGE